MNRLKFRKWHLWRIIRKSSEVASGLRVQGLGVPDMGFEEHS